MSGKRGAGDDRGGVTVGGMSELVGLLWGLEVWENCGERKCVGSVSVFQINFIHWHTRRLVMAERGKKKHPLKCMKNRKINTHSFLLYLTHTRKQQLLWVLRLFYLARRKGKKQFFILLDLQDFFKFLKYVVTAAKKCKNMHFLGRKGF